MDYEQLFVQFAVVTIMDICDEVLVVWDIMLCRSDILLCGLRQVDWMDWRLMLCPNHDHLLVYTDGHIPWII